MKIVSLEFLPLVVALLLGPLFVFPRDRWNWVILAGVGVLWGWNWILKRKILPTTPIDTAIALLCVMAFIGVFTIKDVRGSAGKLAGLVYGIVVFYLLVGILKSSGRMKASMAVFLTAGLGIAVIGTLGRIPIDPIVAPIEAKLFKIPQVKFDLEGAEPGVNPNPLGGTLLLFVPIAIMQLPLLLKKRFEYAASWMRRPSLFGMIFLLVVQSVAIVLTSSIGTWLALALALWLMGEWKRPQKIVIAWLFIALLVFSFLKTGETVQGGSSIVLRIINTSVKGRVDIWKAGLEVVENHPFFGIGMDQIRRAPKYFNYEYSHAHNQFLHTAAELGIPGLIAYAAILIGIFWMAREVRRSALPEWMRLASRGLGTGIFAFTLFGLGDAIPLGAKPGIFFWISLAMISSIYLYGRDNGLLKKNA